MERKYPHLSSPITIGRTMFRNRMFSAPMGGTDITNDGCIGPKSTAFYELRAKGGAAAVTVSELMVHPATDGSHAYHLDERQDQAEDHAPVGTLRNCQSGRRRSA